MKGGFIGTGNIGTPMASNILTAGFSLVVHAVVKSKATPLLQQGAEWADSSKEVAARCDIICTCLPGPPQMEEVTLGPGGIVEGMRQGVVYIDHTTNSPLAVRKVHDIFGERGVDMWTPLSAVGPKEPRPRPFCYGWGRPIYCCQVYANPRCRGEASVPHRRNWSWLYL